MPNMTDIGHLALLVAAISALCAWVSTSSELLAYAGMQMAFAFYLGVLQGFGPTDDLTVLRDRLVGIVLGNVLMSVVFATVWPVSLAAHARGAMADALAAIGRVLRDPMGSVASRLAIGRALSKARQLVLLTSFEPGILGIGRPSTPERRGLDRIDALAAASFVVVNQVRDGAVSDGELARRSAAADWLGRYADALRARAPAPNPPEAHVADRLSKAAEADRLLYTAMREARDEG
jgi:multidrug resistance protein MdtO